jgi:hypothetical protein
MLFRASRPPGRKDGDFGWIPLAEKSHHHTA